MRKAIGMFAAVIVALAMTGAAFAHWSEVIKINGTVTTGILDLTPSCEIRVLSPTDKEVAEVGCEIDNETNTVTCWVRNAFPDLRVRITFGIRNDGTIPAGLKSAKFDDISLYIPLSPGQIIGCLKNKVPGLDVEYFTFLGSPMEQIDPGMTAGIDMIIRFTESTLEDQTYTFTFTFEYWNWNEV